MATATIQVAYEAETSSLKATVNEINQINDKVVEGAQKAAKQSSDAFKKVGESITGAFAGENVKKALNNINLESLKLDFINSPTNLIWPSRLIPFIFNINATVISGEGIFTVESIIKKNRLVLSLRGLKEVKETSFYKA
jgi:uncharacterized protein YvpB